MHTCPNHHRAKHRGRIRRFALPTTVVCGLTLATQWSLSPESTFLSTANAQGPSAAPRKVQPKIVDFGKLAKQKAEARRLMDLARKAVANGDLDAAQRHAEQAAAVPVEWNLGETSPKKFLAELADDSTRLSESSSNSAAPDSPIATRRPVEILSSSTAPEVIELEFPKSRSSERKNLDEDEEQDESPKTPKSLQSIGFKANAGEPVENTVTSDAAKATPRTDPRFSSIPSAEELAESASLTKSPTSQSIQQLSNGATIPTGRLDDTTTSSHSSPAVQYPGLRSQPQTHETVPTTTTVIHEFRMSERTAAADSATTGNSSLASQLLLNINSLMMAGLFGALVLLVGVAVAVLRKFGPNPQFTFKVELNQPLGFAAAAASTVAAVTAPVAIEPVVTTPTPPSHVSPIYAIKRQMEAELEQQQEDAMMRKVFEDNLKLREQIEETRIAA